MDLLSVSLKAKPTLTTTISHGFEFIADALSGLIGLALILSRALPLAIAFPPLGEAFVCGITCWVEEGSEAEAKPVGSKRACRAATRLVVWTSVGFALSEADIDDYFSTSRVACAKDQLRLKGFGFLPRPKYRGNS